MLELISESNSLIFDELVQDYEDEFSSLTGKKKNQEGKYSVDVDWRTPNVGNYWNEGSNIVGFCIRESIDRASKASLSYELAKKFWRKVICDYANANYTELQIDDLTCGLRVCQRSNNQN